MEEVAFMPAGSVSNDEELKPEGVVTFEKVVQVLTGKHPEEGIIPLINPYFSQ